MIPEEDVPNRVQRAMETTLKRDLFRLEDRAVKELADIYRANRRAYRLEAREMADALGIRKLEQDTTGRRWRMAFGAAMERRLTRLTDVAAALALRYSVAAWAGGYYGRAWLLNGVTGQRVNMRQWDAATLARQIVTGVGLREDEYEDTIRLLLENEWRELFANNLDETISKIKKAIWAGMEAGEGIDEIVLRVDDLMGSLGVEGYSANFARIQTIVRTVVNQASNNGAIDIFRQNPDLLMGYQWLTARDERVCPTCRELNGTVYDLSENIRPPAHSNCRCTIIPLLRSGDSGQTGLETLPEWVTKNAPKWWLAAFGY